MDGEGELAGGLVEADPVVEAGATSELAEQPLSHNVEIRRGTPTTSVPLLPREDG
jgi:hypothetical protein